ncbi:MAG: flippase-like domain-containing protein [Pseudobutyrivibrio sp.]|nr:flippase-like domain-containing protein [Pseudobutyrivibrio sp.]
MNKAQMKKVFWMLFSTALSILTVGTLLKQSETMSVETLIEKIGNADLRWIIIAMICSVGYVIFEAVALCSILKGLGHRKRINNGIIYSTADVYFSAITPSATGGQPASAFFMVRDGIPAGVASAALILNLMMYNASIVFLGVIAIIIAPTSFMGFKLSSKILIVLGFVGLSLLSLFFLSVLKASDKIFSTIRRFLNFLYAKKIVHKLEHKLEKLDKIEADYNNCSALISGKNKIMRKAFLWNVIQRASQIIVPTLVFISMGGSGRLSKLLFAKQCLITIGYNYVPIPGALGIADYLMIDGFSNLMTEGLAYELDMISRGLTFYICVALSGLITLFGYLKGRKKR